MIKQLPLRSMLPFRSAVTCIGHVAMLPEVQFAVTQWVKSKISDGTRGILIGGLAMSFYAKPRTTEDVDLLFLSVNDIPSEVQGFKRYRPGAFQDNLHHVNIEVTTPASFNPQIPKEIADKVHSTAIPVDGILVASREGMIALKLCSCFGPRRMSKDVADIVQLLSGKPDCDMSDWGLTPDQLVVLDKSHKEATEE